MARGIVIGGLNTGGGSKIKSVQHLKTNISSLTVDIPITSVDVNKTAILVNMYQTSNLSVDVGNAQIRGFLTDGNTVRLSRKKSEYFVTASVVVIEFAEDIQFGSFTVTNSNSLTTIPISTVDPNKALIFINSEVDGFTTALAAARIAATIINSEQIEISASQGSIVNWYVAEV